MFFFLHARFLKQRQTLTNNTGMNCVVKRNARSGRANRSSLPSLSAILDTETFVPVRPANAIGILFFVSNISCGSSKSFLFAPVRRHTWIVSRRLHSTAWDLPKSDPDLTKGNYTPLIFKLRFVCKPGTTRAALHTCNLAQL